MLVIKKDPIYKSFWLLKFINKLFSAGKKGKMFKRIYNLLKNKKTVYDFELLLMESLEVLRVPLAIKKLSKKREVPFFISKFYQYNQALRWLVSAIKSKKRLLEFSIIDELNLIVALNTSSLALKQKREHELLLYKRRFFKHLPKR